MEMNPQRVRSAEFKTVRKGADPEEVRTFLSDVADELERAQNQSTAMEARARAAVARLQEISDGQAQAATPSDGAAGGDAEPINVPADQSETISRTLLLAQRTADSLVAEAKSEAARLIGNANDEAARTRDSTREMAATMLAEAREEARRVGEGERLAMAGEVDALKARRDFLESDVDHLERFLVDQRSRLRDAAGELMLITDRVPAGLGEVRRPLLSASDDETPGTGYGVPSGYEPTVVEPAGQSDRQLDGDEIVAAESEVADEELDPTEAIELVLVTEIADEPDDGEVDDEVDDGPGVTYAEPVPAPEPDGPLFSIDDLPEEPKAATARFDRLDDAPRRDDDDFRFSFDDGG